MVWTNQPQECLERGSDPRNFSVLAMICWSFPKEISWKKTEAGEKVINQDYFVVIIIVDVILTFQRFQILEYSLSDFTAAGGPRFNGFNSKAISKQWTQFVSDWLQWTICENTSDWDCEKLGEKLGTLGQTVARKKKIQQELEGISEKLETNCFKLLRQLGKCIRRCWSFFIVLVGSNKREHF